MLRRERKPPPLPSWSVRRGVPTQEERFEPFEPWSEGFVVRIEKSSPEEEQGCGGEVRDERDLVSVLSPQTLRMGIGLTTPSTLTYYMHGSTPQARGDKCIVRAAAESPKACYVATLC